MKIKIIDNAESKYLAESQFTNYEWARKLRDLEGKWLEVDTEYLFED